VTSDPMDLSRWANAARCRAAVIGMAANHALNCLCAAFCPYARTLLAANRGIHRESFSSDQSTQFQSVPDGLTLTWRLRLARSTYVLFPIGRVAKAQPAVNRTPEWPLKLTRAAPSAGRRPTSGAGRHLGA
jgi:hypothetical protein